MEKREIGLATLSDLAEILSLQKLAYRSEANIYNDYTLSALLQDDESFQRGFESGIVLKAVLDNYIIGSVRAKQMEGTCYIAKLIVSPE